MKWVLRLVVTMATIPPALLAPNYYQNAAASQRPDSDTTVDDPGRAIDIAMRELVKRQLLVREEFQLTVRRKENTWVLWFVFLPIKFGEDVTVFVSRNGDVTVQLGF